MKKSYSHWLRHSDPLNDDPGLSPAAAQEMRRTVVRAIHVPPAAVPWSEALTVAVAVAGTLVVGVLAGRQLPPRAVAPFAPASSSRPLEPRQLQFATPGGTRIIWVFDPEFTVKETIP